MKGSSIKGNASDKIKCLPGIKEGLFLVLKDL